MWKKYRKNDRDRYIFSRLTFFWTRNAKFVYVCTLKHCHIAFSKLIFKIYLTLRFIEVMYAWINFNSKNHIEMSLQHMFIHLLFLYIYQFILVVARISLLSLMKKWKKKNQKERCHQIGHFEKAILWRTKSFFQNHI